MRLTRNEKERVQYLFKRKYRYHQRLPMVKSCKGLSDHVKEIMSKIDKELEKYGCSEKYAEFLDKNQLKLEGEMIQEQRKERCYHFLKALQNHINTNKDILSPCNCPFEKADSDCCFCNDFKEATEEEESRYCSNFDIDTNEFLGNLSVEDEDEIE